MPPPLKPLEFRYERIITILCYLRPQQVLPQQQEHPSPS